MYKFSYIPTRAVYFSGSMMFEKVRGRVVEELSDSILARDLTDHVVMNLLDFGFCAARLFLKILCFF